MDKGIIFSIIIAAAVSITAAMFWDKIVDIPKMDTVDQEDSATTDEIAPNKDTVEYEYQNKAMPQIITYPTEGKPKVSPKPPRQPKPTANDPVRPQNNTENTSDTNVENVDTNDVKTHIVKRNESLSKISKIYYETEKYWQYLKEFNHLPDEKIVVGQKLQIPSKPQN